MPEEPIDEEMLDLFQAESTEQLEALEQALLQLEDQPGDEEAADAARRQAHNLKGASRILGFQGVEQLAHGIEDLLQASEEGLGGTQINALFEALDTLQRLVDTATETGRSADVPLEDVLAELERARRMSGQDTTEGEPAEDRKPAGDEPEEETEDALARARSFRIDTIRVDPDRLDALMRRASELSSTIQGLATVRDVLARSREMADELGETVRRDLADDVEPQVAQDLRRTTEDLADGIDTALDRIETDRSHLARLAEALEGGIQETRLLPMSTSFNLFARAVRDLARDEDKQVDLEIEGEQVRVDKRVLEELNGPLMHLVRNAVDHGIEPPAERRAAGKDPTGRIRLAAQRTPDAVRVEVEDDGRGIEADEIRRLARDRELLDEAELADLGDGEVVDLVFGAGVTTRETADEVSGRGIGLQTVAHTAEELHGSVSLETVPGEGTRVSIEVPVELTSAHVLLVCAGPHTYGLPVDNVHRVLQVSPEDVDTAGERATIQIDDEAVPVAGIHEALAISRREAPPQQEPRPCVVVRWGGQRLGLVPDTVVGETELVVQPLGGVLQDTEAVTGASLLANGQVCVILEPSAVAEGIRRSRGRFAIAAAREQPRARRVLLVEDNEATRRQLQRTLEHAGWETRAEEGGDRALEALETGDIDAVVTDILMPGLDGLELTRRIRAEPAWRDMPVVLLSTRGGDKEAEEAMRAGADAFVSKEAFDPAELVSALEEHT